MTTIRVLPESVQNQIAAGEVVERPASVLKELLENALDAGAEEVEVSFRRGGIDRLEVRDDGRGIPRDELPLTVQRHATSKIQSADDLETVESLGFRGEALASIASVARFEICSRPEEQAEAARMVLEPGGEPEIEPAARRPGTTVIVEELFANVPARRKFLKTESTERRHLYRQVHRTALANPNLRLVVEEGDERKLVVPAGDLEERISSLLGEDSVGEMIQLDRLEGNWKDLGRFGLSGRIGTGEVVHRDRNQQYFFVNGRPIRDPMLYRAVDKAYEEFLRYDDENPPLVLFLDMPREHLDVNVHPRKEEIRFHPSQEVFRFVKETLQERLRDHHRDRVRTGELAEDGEDDVGSRSGSIEGTSRQPGAGESVEPRSESGDGTERARDLFDAEEPDQRAPSSRVLGQFRNTYLVVERSSGLMLVDQHTAHERILYERYMDRAEHQDKSAQSLSVPWTLEFSPEAAEHLLEVDGELEELGIELESFGGGSLVLHTLPSYLGRRSEDKREIVDMLEEFLDWTEEGRVTSVEEDVLTIMACRSAVMRGDRLLPREQRELVKGLEELTFPARCPHGRAISHEIGNPKLARWFQRPKDDLCSR